MAEKKKIEASPTILSNRHLHVNPFIVCYTTTMNVSSFPSRFAVFRGPPPTNSVPFEWIDSVMLFDSTECETEADGDYIAATLRPWVAGSFVLDENPITPDATIYDIKIHTPSISRWIDNHCYMRSLYSITKHSSAGTGLFEFQIPVLVFQSTDWMHQTTSPMFRHVLECGESSLLQMRQMLFLAVERMRLHPNITRFLEKQTNLYDLIYYPSRNEPERTDHEHIAFWYDRLFHMPGSESLASSLPPTEQDTDHVSRNLNDAFIAEADTAEELSEAPVPFEPLGWNAQPSDWPVFVYQNHVRMEMSKGTECAITMTKLADMTEFAVSPKCGHIFEPVALTKWLKDASAKGDPMVCPLCRTDVPNGAMYIRFGTE